MAQSTASSERGQIIQWFETDFKEYAKRTTSTSRLEDGRVSYKFSVVNNSGYSFSRFSFRVKIINRNTGQEIGSATINTGEWASGETRNFRSRIAIPRDVRNISFIMYSESVDYDIVYTDPVSSTFRDIGDMMTGADGSGGVLGELFGTGGMPETTTTTKTTTRTASGTTTKTTTTTRTSDGRVKETKTTTTREPSSRTYNRQSQKTLSPMQTYTKRKTEKKLNKLRLGKSGWTVATLAFGALMTLAAFGAYSQEQMIGYAAVGAISLISSLVIKLVNNAKAKRIRTYESKINKKGNTSIDELAAYAGRKPEQCADDLQKMIVDGFFPEAYIDINNRLLVMTKDGEPIESPEKTAAANKIAKRKAARDKGLVPESIDDLITMTDDGQIKVKLRELRTITKKIDQRVEERPDLTDQVKEFRDKYYPEVVRLTDEYNEKIAKLDTEMPTTKKDDLEINANPNYLQEQAREIKDQLIKLIDSVTEASENLLEKLHEDDIMDITTDIKMLQTTLASKGLLDSDFDIKV